MSSARPTQSMFDDRHHSTRGGVSRCRPFHAALLRVDRSCVLRSAPILSQLASRRSLAICQITPGGRPMAFITGATAFGPLSRLPSWLCQIASRPLVSTVGEHSCLATVAQRSVIMHADDVPTHNALAILVSTSPQELARDLIRQLDEACAEAQLASRNMRHEEDSAARHTRDRALRRGLTSVDGDCVGVCRVVSGCVRVSVSFCVMVSV